MKELFNVVNPFNGEIVGVAPVFPFDKIDDLINKSFDYKPPYDGKGRGRLLLEIAAALKTCKNEIASLMSNESGISLSQTLNEVERSIVVLKEASATANKIDEIDLSSNYKSIFQIQLN